MSQVAAGSTLTITEARTWVPVAKRACMLILQKMSVADVNLATSLFEDNREELVSRLLLIASTIRLTWFFKAIF